LGTKVRALRELIRKEDPSLPSETQCQNWEYLKVKRITQVVFNCIAGEVRAKSGGLALLWEKEVFSDGMARN